MKRKERIHSKFNGRCAYCGCACSIELVCIDHIYPRFLGGGSEDDNLYPSCRSCNSIKRHKTMDEFRFWLSVRDFATVRGFSSEQIKWLSENTNVMELIKPKEVRFYFEGYFDENNKDTK